MSLQDRLRRGAPNLPKRQAITTEKKFGSESMRLWWERPWQRDKKNHFQAIRRVHFFWYACIGISTNSEVLERCCISIARYLVLTCTIVGLQRFLHGLLLVQLHHHQGDNCYFLVDEGIFVIGFSYPVVPKGRFLIIVITSLLSSWLLALSCKMVASWILLIT